MDSPWKFHRLCLRFPPMSPLVYAATKAGMRQDGFRQNHPIVMFRGEIVDGRHRLAIAEELKKEGCDVDPVFEEWNPPEWAKTEEQIQLALDQYTIVENALRRSITDSQMAAIIAKDRGWASNPNVNVTQVARETGIERTVISRVKRIAETSPELLEQVASGEVSTRAAHKRMKGERKIGVPAQRPIPEQRPTPVEPDPEDEPISPTQAGIEKEFQRLRERLGEVVTTLSRMKVISEELDKRVGRGEMWIRTLDAAHSDCERWGKFLKEWATRSGVR